MAQEIYLLTAILSITIAVVLIGRLLKQPPLIGYIVAGLLLGPTFIGLTGDLAILQTLSELGVAFLLFIVGINMDVRTVRRVGAVSVVAGVGQVAITSVVGFFLTRILGFGLIESLYISIAFAFSSTILAIKILSDQQQIERLHGKIAIGVLVVQDLLSILALLIIPSITSSQADLISSVVAPIALLSALLALLWVTSKYLLQKLLHFAGKSTEVLFLFSIAWCFAVASIFALAGFSIEMGALIAGFLLASTPYSYEISSKIKPLRDFFITLFFIILGAQLDLSVLSQQLIPAIVLSAFVLIGNPIIVVGLMGTLGFAKRTSFNTGIYLSQISEFSLILLAFGVSIGDISQEILSLATLVALVTFAFSTYSMLHLKTLYKKVGQYLPYIKRGKAHIDKKSRHFTQHEVVLLGHNRMGYSIARHFQKKNKRLLVIDFDPEQVLQLKKKTGVDAILGDVNDAELFEELALGQVQTVVSTITDVDTNVLVMKEIRKKRPKARFILSAAQPEEALRLYEEGADYVIIPHVVGGEHAAIMLDLADTNFEEFLTNREEHVEELKNRKNK